MAEGQTTQWPKEKGQTLIYKALQSTQKTKNGATRIPLKLGVNSGALKGISVPAPRVKPVKSGLNNSKCKCSDLN